MPPRTREEQQKGGSGTQKRKPVRRDPEKRRQQNIQAQKKYREKLRQRLERLEALAATATQGSPTSQAPHAGQGLSGPETTLDTAQGDSLATDIPRPASGVLTSSLETTPTDYPQLVPLMGDFPLHLNSWDPNSYISRPDDPSLSGIWDPTTLPLSDGTICYPPQVEQTRGFNTTENTVHVPAGHASQPHSSSALISAASNNPITIRSDHTNRPSLAWTTIIDCGCSIPHFTLQSGGPYSANPRQVKILATMPVADPYANNIRVDQHCTLTALFLVVEHVGLTMAEICADESPSPFFRVDSSSADPLTRANVVAAVQKAFKIKLKHDLRPSEEQITISHHPIIDIYPFPTLRNNLVARQGEYDDDEFFHDSLAGLICWGSAGVGQRDRNASAGKASTGAPWDLRSWEAQEWFLKKYWSLMGGEDGELVRQTEWWRSIRGEDALEVVEL
ncbi:bZIP transcription factor [Aspergillus foveolatus]|uniref:bZIP transcription factor n=1 Tax=Aspergillus foveolatus TaxID=210207 RepID=UPI003CCCF6D1